jgi:hypothetical protein
MRTGWKYSQGVRRKSGRRSKRMCQCPASLCHSFWNVFRVSHVEGEIRIYSPRKTCLLHFLRTAQWHPHWQMWVELIYAMILTNRSHPKKLIRITLLMKIAII